MLRDPASQPALAALGEVDLVVLGSGAAGLTAALTGLLQGLRVAVLEVAPRFGGTTARSSGTSWIPDNQLMAAAGFGPDRDEAETYLRALIGNRGPEAPWQAFLEAAPRMHADLESRADIRFRPYMGAPDYSSDLPGAGRGGRPLEPVGFDGRRLGAWFETIADPIPELTVFGGMMVTRAEAARLIRADRSISAMWLGARMVMRHLMDRRTHARGTRLVMGNALIARLIFEIVQRGGLLYRNVSVADLTRDAGRITGVSGSAAGEVFSLRAARGVVLAGGGFPSSPEKRAEHLPRPTAPTSPACPTARGTTIDLGLAAGGQLGPSGLDNAMWFPSSVWARPDGGMAVYPHIALDRAKPGSIAVDTNGQRFTNEAVSYHSFVRGVYAHGAAAVPCWLIGDRRFLKRYGMGVIRPRTPSIKGYVASGYLRHGRDVAALAKAMGVPADALHATINRWNAMAAQGRDDDFGRGSTAYQRSNGDAAHGCAGNPCVAPVGLKDLYAVQLWPTPLGTSRGLMADVDGQVLAENGQPLGGLYVAGNDMQSCFAGEYPGAGAQIGQGMTFGWRVAMHAAAAENGRM